jgi:hypothetical protein
MQRSAERRKHLRFSISVPTLCTWEQPDGSIAKVEGITRDVGASGAYIFCNACPPPSTTVQIELHISQFPGAPTISMIGKMQSLRVELTDLNGFAVAGKTFVSRLARTASVLASRVKSQAPIPIEMHKPIEVVEPKEPDQEISSRPRILSFKSI